MALRGFVVGCIVLASVPLSGCGNLFDCYDANLIGVTGHRMSVVDKKNKRREVHTYADIYTIETIGKWQRGDELIVCNAIVTNTTRNVSAPCGDFGCLAIWP